MSRSFLLSPELADYVRSHSEPVDDVLIDLAAETEASFPDRAGMSTAFEIGTFLTIVCRLIGARRAIEVGTFTGHSAICIARGLGDSGQLLCCDVSDEWTSVAQRYWTRAALSDRIELRLGPAADTLRSLPADAAYDLAFIDADKPNYSTYVDLLHARLRVGGLVAVDNVLWGGRVLDPTVDDENTVAIRKFNDEVTADDRWETQLLAVGDGLTLLRKR
ncbi:MAG: O-methyltransferase [Actinomycetes bacterium]